jgi:DNA adenine methylase
MAKPRSAVEVVNDINGDLVALYRNLQYHLPELLREVDFMFASREQLKDFIAQPGITEIQRAARFLLRNRTSFGANGHSFAVARTQGGGTGLSRVKLGDLLGSAHERLDGVTVERLPYDRCLSLYDSADSFFFLDPPYLNAKNSAYDAFDEKQMREFRDRVDALKGKWLVTVDDSEFNRGLFKGRKMETSESVSGCINQAKSDKKFRELIITK